MTTTQAHTSTATSPDEEWDEFIARRKHRTVTFGSPGAVVNTLFDLLVRAKENRDQQVSALQARIAQLEQQPPSPHYEGTFQDGKAYARGSLTTQSGGLWLALDNTTQRPGRSDQWKLIVKSGEAR